MRGSIRTKVKGKRYEIRVALGLDPKTGRYRQKSLTVRGSRSKAERALRHLLEEVEAGAYEEKDKGSVTFGELLDEWLTFKVAADRSPTTIARYRASIELHLRPSLGTTRLDRLKTKVFDDLYREPDHGGPRRLGAASGGGARRSRLARALSRFDPRDGMTWFEWLATPSQRLAEMTGGAVFHDGLDQLEPIRNRLEYYPKDVWIFVMAAQWQ